MHLSKEQVVRGPIDTEWSTDFYGEEGDASVGTATNSGTSSYLTTKTGGWRRLAGADTTDASGYQIQSRPVVDLQADKFATMAWGVDQTHDTLSSWLMGLAAYDTSLLGGVSDGIYLTKAGGTTAIVLNVMRDSSNVQVTMPFVSDTAEHTYEIIVNASSTAQSVEIIVYRDGVERYRNTFANAPDDELLCASFAVVSTSASGTQGLDLDYALVRAPRVPYS